MISFDPKKPKSILDELEEKIKGYTNIVLAYSGGLDSTVLLHQLMQLREYINGLNIRAIHVNHGLSNYANIWEFHCSQQCLEWKIPFITIKIQIDEELKKRHGIEAAARQARYSALQNYLLKGETLLTAHHLDDQCETFFLALKRGSGPTGLAAMPSIKVIGDNLLLRPFLNQSKKTIQYWAKKHQLRWIIDDTNYHTTFDRNFLRIKILPLLISRWPYFSKVVARSAKWCADQEKLLNIFLFKDLKKLIQSDGSLRIDTLLNYRQEIYSYGIIRRWLTLKKSIRPSYKVIKCIWQELICSRKDAYPCVKIGNFNVRRYRQAIYLINPIPSSLQDYVIKWDYPWYAIRLPYNLGVINLNHNNNGVVQHIRPPNKEEKVTIQFKIKTKGKISILERTRGKRLLKKIWQEFAIPPWRRKQIPFIFYNEKLIAAIGVFVTQEGAPTKTKDRGKIWYLNWTQ
ncbi:MAG: tRNA lysidine(34) synthetase TilS [Candidatus Dasytiphilus stammeri]